MAPAPDLDTYATNLAQLYQEAETALLRIIGRRLARGLDQSNWATQRLAEIGAVSRAAAAVVDRLTGRSAQQTRAAIAAAYRVGNEQAIADMADHANQHLAAGARVVTRIRSSGNAMQALADALTSELRPAHAAILPQTLDVYRRAIAGATARTLAGGQGRRQAAQAAWASLVDHGITVVKGHDGRAWRLHTWVEMATRTALTRARTQAVVDELTAAGQRFVYVSATTGTCKLCAPWQHKVLALWGDVGPTTAPHGRRSRQATVNVAATLEEARRAGLQHPNCRHFIRPYIPGVTKLAAVDYDPTADLVRQHQRYLERGLRHWREQQDLALTPEGATRAAARVNVWEAHLAAHTDRHALTRRGFREHPGAGHVPHPSRRGDTIRVA